MSKPPASMPPFITPCGRGKIILQETHTVYQLSSYQVYLLLSPINCQPTFLNSLLVFLLSLRSRQSLPKLPDLREELDPMRRQQKSVGHFNAIILLHRMLLGPLALYLLYLAKKTILAWRGWGEVRHIIFYQFKTNCNPLREQKFPAYMYSICRERDKA